MTWTKENTNYCLLSFDYLEEAEDNFFAKQSIPISGLFSWSLALNGQRTFPRTPEDFDKFNLFHINVTTRNLQLIPSIIKDIPKSAKVIMNVDFAIEMWYNNLPFPDMLLEQLDKADKLFHVEPTGADILSHALKRKVACMPHPVATHKLKDLRTNNRINQVGVNIHRYDLNAIIPHYITRDLPKGFQSILIGMTKSKMELLHLYDLILENSKFEDLMKHTAQLFAVIETHTMHSYGRYTAECACLGIPCTGFSCVESINRCFPFTSVHTNDAKSLRKSTNLILTDPEFYNYVAQYAIDKSEYYSYDNCVSNLMNLLNSGDS